MKQQHCLSFILLYLSWIGLLALMQFWMQSQYVFLDTLGGNLMMLIYAMLFSLGCFYWLRYFKHLPGWLIPVLIAAWMISYLIIEGLSILFYLSLEPAMIEAIGLSSLSFQEVLWSLWSQLPGQLWQLLTLQHVSHLLDLVYCSLIELGFFSPLTLILLKKDCRGQKKCV